LHKYDGLLEPTFRFSHYIQLGFDKYPKSLIPRELLVWTTPTYQYIKGLGAKNDARPDLLLYPRLLFYPLDLPSSLNELLAKFRSLVTTSTSEQIIARYPKRHQGVFHFEIRACQQHDHAELEFATKLQIKDPKNVPKCDRNRNRTGFPKIVPSWEIIYLTRWSL
jgi:hypothetical protein